MASNVITARIADFIRNYPPFNLFPLNKLQDLCSKVVVQYYKQDEIIFKESNPSGDYFYVVRDGAVELKEGNNLIDICDEGDIFGVRAMMSGKSYVATAQVSEEALIYAIPVVIFKPLLEEYPKVSLFFAAGFAAGQPVLRNDLSQTTAAHKEIKTTDSFPSYRLSEVGTIKGSDALITTTPDASIQEAGQVMSNHNIGSLVIIDDQQRPIGIITDADFRRKVIPGHHRIDEKVVEIMNSPVKCIAKSRPMAEVTIKMVRNKVHHLCITEDGSDQTRAIGMISQHDLLLQQSNNPAVIIKEIKRADAEVLPSLREKATELLRNYLDHEVSVRFICSVISEINDALISRAIVLSQERLEKENRSSQGVKFCWLSLGSEGREEQLLLTDLDNALIYENPPVGQERQVEEYFIKLGEYTNEILISCGFEKCPHDVMASNPQWCKPLSTWKEYFRKWIFEPGEKEVLNATIFFDYRPVFGDKNLAEDLTSEIFKYLNKEKVFLSFLAKDAVQNPPPLSFFRNFIVEQGGEHKQEFDIKARAMIALIDAARVLTLHHNLAGENNTFIRFEKLAEKEGNNAALYKEAALAFEIMIRFRTTHGLKHDTSGRFIKIEELNKLERQMLRNAFKPIEELQSILNVRFQLDYIRS